MTSLETVVGHLPPVSVPIESLRTALARRLADQDVPPVLRGSHVREPLETSGAKFINGLIYR